MIQLDIQSVIFYYVCVSLVALMALWLFSSRGKKLKINGREETSVWKCGICLHDYIDSTSEDMSVCPMCGSYNKREGGV